MKGKGFDMNKIYKAGTNRELTNKEVIEYKIPIKKRSCPFCEEGVLERRPTGYSYKIMDDRFYVLLYINPEGRTEAIKRQELNHLWACDNQECSYCEPEHNKNVKKTKSKDVDRTE